GGARRLDGLRAPPGDGGDEAAARDRALSHLLFRERAPDRAGREARGAGAPAAGKGVLAVDGVRGDGVRDEARVHLRRPRAKRHIVTFETAFHGRTLGAQLAGGTPALKDWIPGKHPEFVQVPFPDGFRTADTSFGFFERSLGKLGVEPDSVCAVMTETYQGC